MWVRIQCKHIRYLLAIHLLKYYWSTLEFTSKIIKLQFRLFVYWIAHKRQYHTNSSFSLKVFFLQIEENIESFKQYSIQVFNSTKATKSYKHRKLSQLDSSTSSRNPSWSLSKKRDIQIHRMKQSQVSHDAAAAQRHALHASLRAKLCDESTIPRWTQHKALTGIIE